MKPLIEMTEIEKSKLLLGLMGMETIHKGENLYSSGKHIFLRFQKDLFRSGDLLAVEYKKRVDKNYADSNGDTMEFIRLTGSPQDTVLELALELGLVED